MDKFPLVYKDKDGNEIRLRRDKFRKYYDEHGNQYAKSYVWENFKFVSDDKNVYEYFVTPNGFKVRKNKAR